MKKRFLIIRFSSIGDIILTTPIVRCLKIQFPEAEIFFLTKKQNIELLINNKYIDKIIIFDNSLYHTLKEIKSYKIDYIIDLHKSIRSRIFKLLLMKKSYSFPKLNFKKFLLTKFKINLLPDVHIVDRYFYAVKKFGILNDNQGLDFFLDEKNSLSIKELPEEFYNGYVALVLGAKHYTKQIPVDLAVQIIKKSELPFVLLGDENDYEKGEQVKNECNNYSVYNACGKFNIQQSAWLIYYSKVVVTSDTGLMHIAAALNKKIVSIWGNTVPQFGMYPYTKPENYIISEVKLPCRPCSKLGYKSCPQKHFNCMMQQDVNFIVKNVIKFYYEQ